MTDKVTDAVRDATMRTRRLLQEGMSGGARGDMTFNKDTGIGKTTHHTDDVQIDTIVTPKESNEC